LVERRLPRRRFGGVPSREIANHPFSSYGVPCPYAISTAARLVHVARGAHPRPLAEGRLGCRLRCRDVASIACRRVAAAFFAALLSAACPLVATAFIADACRLE
jgi:hypothetical protein